MKKYILFLLTILIVLGTTLVTNMLIIKENINKTFNASGYILRSEEDSERYHFSDESTYKKSYNDQIVFKDTEGQKKVVNRHNFIHYEDGSISSFTKGVLLDLDTIDTEPITYYNISANKTLKKLSNNKYVTKNLDKELQFSNLMWRISATKYLVAGNSITIIFADGTEKQITGFLEIEYSDNEIVKIFNQEVNYETISSDVYLKIGENIKVNLGTKIVSKNDVNEMTLENMVIDSNDNVTIVDLDEYKEEKEDEKEDEKDKDSTNNSSGGGNVSNIEGGNASSSAGGDSVANGGNVNTGENNNNGNNNGENTGNNNGGNNSNDDIIIEIEEDLSAYDPKFVIKKFDVMSTMLMAQIGIVDEEMRLTQDTVVQILDNSTGKAIPDGTSIIPLGRYEIPINVPTLQPNKEYTFVVSSAYKIGDTEYSKNFIHKIFRTPILGLAINKDIFTDTSLAFNIDFEADSDIKSLNLSLLDPLGEENVRNKNNITNIAGNQRKVEFTDLTPDKEYILKISNMDFETAPLQEYKSYEYTYKTLKRKYKFKTGETITKLDVQKNERESTFTLTVPEINLENDGIELLNYEIYTLTEDMEEIVYNKTISKTSITLEIDDNILKRNTNYYARVFALLYDNEKSIEYQIAYTPNSFTMDSARYPTLDFVEENITFESINGMLKLEDEYDTLNLNDDIIVKCVWANNKSEVVATITQQNLSRNNISIPININNLRKGTTYLLEVYATINLRDGNDEIENHYIGAAIVNTKNDAELYANWTMSKTGASKSIGLQLSSTKGENASAEEKNLAANTLTRMKIRLYEGETIEGREVMAECLINDEYINKGEEYRSKLREDFYDKKAVIIDENNYFLQREMGDDKVQITNGRVYTLEITQLYDYTTNENADTGEKGNLIDIISRSGKDDNGIYNQMKTYTFIAGEALPPNPSEQSQYIKTSIITKEDLKINYTQDDFAAENGDRLLFQKIINDENIDNKTPVAIKMQAQSAIDTYINGSITYYVYDDYTKAYDIKKSVAQADGSYIYSETRKILKEQNTELVPSAIMLLDNAKSSDIRTRGKRYYFTCEITTASNPPSYYPYYANDKTVNWWAVVDGKPLLDYPEAHINKHTINLELAKQQARIVIYPSVSTVEFYKFKYKLTDTDNSLLGPNNSDDNIYFKCYLDDTECATAQTVTETESANYNDITFSFNNPSLLDGGKDLYIVVQEYKKESNPDGETRFLFLEQDYKSPITLTENNFSYELQQIEGCENSKFQITIRNNQISMDKISKIKVNFKVEGTISEFSMDYVPEQFEQSIVNKEFIWKIQIPYYQIAEKAGSSNSIKDKNIEVSLDIYYVDGSTGFDVNSSAGTAFYGTLSEWLKIDNAIIRPCNYPKLHSFVPNSNFPYYRIDNYNVEIVPSEGYGVKLATMANEGVLPKQVSVFNLRSAEAKFKFENVVPAISGLKTYSLLDNIELEMNEFKNKDSLADDCKLYIEIYDELDKVVEPAKRETTITNLKSNSIYRWRVRIQKNIFL